MKLFFSLFEKKNDDEDEKKPKPRKSRRKATAGIALILLFAMSLYAQPAAAYPWDSAIHKVSSTLHGIKEKIKEHHTAIIGVALIAGGIVLSATGVGASAGAYLILGGVGMIGIDSLLNRSKGGNGGDDDVLNYRAAQNATTADLEDDKDVVNSTAKALDDTQQAAYKQIAELNAMLRSDLTKYDFTEDGATGDLWAEVYAPQKVYGFSAFPVQVDIHVAKSNIPFSAVHIRSIRVYVKEDNSSTALWTRTWDYGTAGSEGLNGEEVVYSTILKVPDPYAYQVKQMLDSGQIDKNLVLEIFKNATTKPWEIFVDVSAYREQWQSDPQYTDKDSCTAQPHHKWDDNTSTCYVFVKNVDIDYHIQTTSAWRHVTMANDLAILNEGMWASLPVKFVNTILKSRWSLYQETFAGAVSDFTILTYANPVHVMGSTADYMFYIGPTQGYFDPLDVTLSDDFRFFTVRVLQGGSWELADSIFGSLGNITVPHKNDTTPPAVPPKKLNAHYTTSTNILTYNVLGIAYFTITRKDGQKIPIWEIVWPKVSVEPNTHTVMDDTQIQQLVTLVNQSAIDNETLAQLKSDIQAMVNGLNDKLRTAQAIEKNAEGVKNTQAAGYAKKAEMAYKYAIDALNHAASSNDKQTILNYLNAAKKYEQAGDFYMSAAKKALYGAPEQAKLDAQMGDHLSNLASQYEPHIDVLGTAKNALSQKVRGIPLWVLLVIIFALAGAFVIWKKLL